MRFYTNLAAKRALDFLVTDTVKIMLLAAQKTGGATNSNTNCTMTSTTGVIAGMGITGTNIPAGTTVASVTNGTTIVLSQAATGTGTGFTFTFHGHEDLNTVDKISGLEVSGTGYTAGFGGAGRKTLATKTSTEDDANNRSAFDAADLSWPGLNAGIVTGFALIKEITNDAGSELLYYCSDGGFPITTNGGTFDLILDATGLLYANVTVS